jgi:hypothetical protein
MSTTTVLRHVRLTDVSAVIAAIAAAFASSSAEVSGRSSYLTPPRPAGTNPALSLASRLAMVTMLAAVLAAG